MIKATNNSKHYNREPYEDIDNTWVQWDQSHEESTEYIRYLVTILLIIRYQVLIIWYFELVLVLVS